MRDLTAKQQKMIHDLGYDTPLSFLEHFPFRYETRVVAPFDAWKEGDELVFFGTLASSFKSFRFGRNQSRTTFEVAVDDTVVTVTIFNRPYLRMEHYNKGIVVIGTYQGKGRFLAKSVSNQPLESQLGIKPVYPLKAGVRQFEVQRLMKKVLEMVVIEDRIPADFVAKYRLMSRREALNVLHFPSSQEALTAALRTLKYEEFLLYQLYGQMNQMKRVVKKGLAIDGEKMHQRIQTLPYTLTADQLISLEDIVADLAAPKQMNRLLQGDVGSGKTVVALLAALACIDLGYQVVFMVPTDVLMEQHLMSIRALFPDLPLLSLASSTTDKAAVLEKIAAGEAGLIVGTHALFQEAVQFAKLGLVIIDEQHRFGVKQREALINKAEHPDILLLSATPIPRTLAASLFFDLDVSTIETVPAFRKPVKTVFIEENSMRSIVDDVKARLKAKEQVYIVCPAIEDASGVRNVVDIHEQMVRLFSDYKVGLMHGQLKANEKEAVMGDFKKGKLDILVSTTVIEVGIDVHNANTMIIYNAEMFGLATLHQLRGRVGRGSIQGICFLLSDNKAEGKQRLELLTRVYSGFDLSLEDLRTRGMGDLLGSRQSGIPGFLLGDVVKDVAILDQAKKDAAYILAHKANYTQILKWVKANTNRTLGV